MTGGNFVVSIVPRWADVDPNQHMRHSAYADWATHARSAWLDARGLDLQRFAELNVAPIIFEDGARYFKEIRLGERITIELQIAGSNRDGSRWRLRHTFRRGDTVCAVYEAAGAWFDLVTRHIVPAPSAVLDAMADLRRTDDYEELGVSAERTDHSSGSGIAEANTLSGS